MRTSAARAATASSPRAWPGSVDAMGGQYIEAMLAMRWPDTKDDAARSPGVRLPSLCAVCHDWGDRRVCTGCVDRFAAPLARCARCALPLPSAMPVCGACLAAPPPYDAALACFDYRAPWDRLIAAYKFHSALDLTSFFVESQLAAEARRAAARPS